MKTRNTLCPSVLFGIVLQGSLVMTPAAAQTVFPAPDWQVVKPETQSMSPAALEKVGQWLKDSGARPGSWCGTAISWPSGISTTPGPRRSTWSIPLSKSFSGTAAGLAIGAGKLTLDSKVGDFFPDAESALQARDHRAAVVVDDLGAHNDNAILKREDLFKYVLSELPMDFPPGEKWDYNNSGLSLLSPVVHKATGKNIDQLLDEQVFKKIGIGSDDWSWEDRDGMPIPYSGLHITARALARFGLLLLNKGQWRGGKVISSDWMNDVARPSQEMNQRYGYLWWTNRRGAWSKVPRDAFASMGKFDNDMLIVPSLDLIVIAPGWRRLGTQS